MDRGLADGFDVRLKTLWMIQSKEKIRYDAVRLVYDKQREDQQIHQDYNLQTVLLKLN